MERALASEALLSGQKTVSDTTLKTNETPVVRPTLGWFHGDLEMASSDHSLPGRHGETSHPAEMTEETVRDARQRLATVVGNAPIVLWAIDSRGTFTLSEGKGLAPLGLEPGAAVGRSVFEMFADVPQVVDQIHRALAGETFTVEVTIQNLVYDSFVTPIYDQQGQIAGAIGVATDVTRRKEAEDELRRSHQQLENRVAQRTAELTAANASLRSEIAQRKRIEGELRGERRLLGELLNAHERDRKLVAYEIHDGLVQDIAGSLMHLEAQVQHLDLSANQTNGFELGLGLLRNSLDEARRLITGLRPPIIDERGIIEAIQYLIDEPGGDVDLNVEFKHDVSFDRMTPLLEGTLFRVVQEGLNNIRRHSKAQRALIRLTHDDREIVLELRDWGIGFDVDEVEPGRFGIKGIKERSRLLRGSAEIVSTPGEGTRITIHLPITNPISLANHRSEE